MRRFATTTRVPAALAMLVVLAASCGGRMSAEEYFTAAAEASATYDQRTDEIFDAYREVVAQAADDFRTKTEDADTQTLISETAILLEITVTEVTAAFEQAEAALADFVAALSELTPPTEVQDAHDTAVAALQRSLDAIPDLITAFSTVQSLDDISAVINASTFGDTQPRVTAACLELQGLADDAGIAADLRCGSTA